MTNRLQQMSPRELVLATVVLLLLIGFWSVRAWILPAYDEWSASRAITVSKYAEYDKLASFLVVKDAVDLQYDSIDAAAYQADTDQITMSRFLRQVEAIARHPNMTIINAKPQKIEDFGTYRRFPIRLTVSGTLPEVTRFASALLSGEDVTGMHSFSLRGVQGGRYVECSLSIWLVSLAPEEKPAQAENSELSPTSIEGRITQDG